MFKVKDPHKKKQTLMLKEIDSKGFSLLTSRTKWRDGFKP
jgi:hypothetical protein